MGKGIDNIMGSAALLMKEMKLSEYLDALYRRITESGREIEGYKFYREHGVGSISIQKETGELFYVSPAWAHWEDEDLEENPDSEYQINVETWDADQSEINCNIPIVIAKDIDKDMETYFNEIEKFIKSLQGDKK